MGEKPTVSDEAASSGQQGARESAAPASEEQRMGKASPELMRAAGETGTEPTEASNLNSSKSNINREQSLQEPSNEASEPGEPSGLAVSDPGAGGSKSDKK